MREIQISITKARITRFEVVMEKDLPRVTATIDLLTAGGKSISSYSISSDHWQSEMKFELPPDMIFPIREIADRLESIVREHCENSVMRLEGPREVVEPAAVGGA